MQGPERVAAKNGLSRRMSRAARAFLIYMCESVELGLEGFDAPQVMLDQFLRRNFFFANFSRKFGQRKVMEIRHGVPSRIPQ